MLMVKLQPVINVGILGKHKKMNIKSRQKIFRTMKTILVLILALTSIIYLLNPTAGIFELLPDNLPFIGNIDEGLAALVIYSSVEYFKGKKIGIFGQRKK